VNSNAFCNILLIEFFGFPDAGLPIPFELFYPMFYNKCKLM